MATGVKQIYVYDSFSRESEVVLGILYVDIIRGGESYSFEYNHRWLSEFGESRILDPDLPTFMGRQFPVNGELFGVFKDSAPDRWGRTLMNKRERILAEKEDRKPRKLQESDYMLGVFDTTRMGGLRFKLEEEGAFLSEDKDISVPPWTRLRTLEEASRKFESEDNELPGQWLEQLIKPGSSLGGARPKANVSDENGELWIAKFPSRHDENDTGAWEKVVWDMAETCGLNVPEARLEKFSKYGSTFLSKRFDRDKDRRIHYASAMTLLGKNDGASAQDGTSYLDIASFIRAYGAKPKEDLKELWRRIVFNMAVSNTDDHLRNHAFILNEKGWVLSPMFDVNPIPYGNELSLNVNEADNSISMDLAIDTASKFGISSSDACKQVKDITGAVNSNLKKVAKKYDLSRTQIEAMRPAFSFL